MTVRNHPTRRLSIQLQNCGDKTCASEPGVFCDRLRTIRMGTEWVCGLFGDVLRDDKGDGTGWLLRCDECLRSEEK